MPGRVIQGFFVGGAMRAMPGIVRAPMPGTAASIGPPMLAHRGGAGVSAGQGVAAQRAVAGRPAALARPAAPPAAFTPAVAQPRVGAPGQVRGAAGAFEVDPARLGLVPGGGSRLPPAVQAKMEAAFGADFSAVRVHVGPQAARIGAIAFTTGNDIYFAPGRYQPDTMQGQQLVGHELAHVVQQRQGRVRAAGGGVTVVQDRALESEADRLGMRAAMSRAIAAPIQRAAQGPARSGVVQRAAQLICDACGYGFDSERERASHIAEKHGSRKRRRADDEKMSDWEADSLDEADEEEAFRKSRGGNQRKLYRKRGSLKKKFHSSAGLADAVTLLGGGKAPKANTHVLLSGPRPKKGPRPRLMAHASTVNAMRAMTLRHGAINLPAVQNIIGKKKHVHTEMYLIWILTGGDAKKIDGCMTGMNLVVDKPICVKCLPFVKRAGPTLIDDRGNDPDPKKQVRGDWKNWRNPFEMKGVEPPPNPFA